MKGCIYLLSFMFFVYKHVYITKYKRRELSLPLYFCFWRLPSQDLMSCLGLFLCNGKAHFFPRRSLSILSLFLSTSLLVLSGFFGLFWSLVSDSVLEMFFTSFTPLYLQYGWCDIPLSLSLSLFYLPKLMIIELGFFWGPAAMFGQSHFWLIHFCVNSSIILGYDFVKMYDICRAMSILIYFLILFVIIDICFIRGFDACRRIIYSFVRAQDPTRLGCYIYKYILLHSWRFISTIFAWHLTAITLSGTLAVNIFVWFLIVDMVF